MEKSNIMGRREGKVRGVRCTGEGERVVWME